MSSCLFRTLSSLLLATLLVACSTSGDDDRLALLEERVTNLENAQLSLPPDADLEASREVVDSGRESVPPAREAELAQALDSPLDDLLTTATAVFSESLFWGFPPDPEFGGLEIDGATDNVTIVLSGEAMSDTGLAVDFLRLLTFIDSDVSVEALSNESLTLTNLDNTVEVSWITGPGSLRLEVVRVE